MVLVRPTPPPVAVPSTQNRQNVVGHFGPAAVLRGLGGGHDGHPKRHKRHHTDGATLQIQHTYMYDQSYFGGLEMASKLTFPF